MNVELSNRQLWLMVGVMLAVYLILILEDIAAGLKRNRYIVIGSLDGGRTIEGTYKTVTNERNTDNA